MLAAAGGCDQRLEFSRPAESSAPPSTPAATDRAVTADLESLLSTALDVYYDGAYDSAGTLLGQVADAASRRGDARIQARALTWLGLSAWRQGRYGEAREVGQRALDLKLEADLGDQLSRSYNALGLVAWDESRFEEAAQWFERAAEAADRVHDAAGEARAAGNLALVATEWGEFARARAGYTTMLRAGRALDDAVMAGNALANLGMLEIRVGQTQDAIPLLHEALELYGSIDYAAGMENAYGQLGSAYAALGNLGQAHVMLDSALAIARSHGLRQQEANDLEVLAELYVAGDNRVRALELNRDALELYRSTGLETELGRARRSRAKIFAELGNLQGAREQATAALTTHRRVGARFEELDDLVALAELDAAVGSDRSADSLLAAARDLASELDTRAARAIVALAEARILDGRGDAKGVLAAIGAAGVRLFGGDYETEWEAHALRSRAFLRLGQADSAINAGWKAVRTVERVRGSFRSRAMRAGFAAARHETYADLVRALLEANRTAEAFAVSDQARGRTLRAHLGQPEGGPPPTNAEEAGRAEELLHRIGQLVTTLDAIQAEGGSGADSAAELLWTRLSKARSDYEIIQIGRKEGSTGTQAPPPVLESDVRTSLRAGETLLEYFVMPDQVLTFVLTPDSSFVVSSPTSMADLESRVRLVRKLMAEPGNDPLETAPVLEVLYETLIAPAATARPVLEAERLILVPHGVLNYLPFAALRRAGTSRHLAEILPLVHLPTAASLVELRARAASRGATSRLSERETYVLAPFPEALPATDDEARAVAERRRGIYYRGATATEARLRGLLESGGLVHFASHASMNARNPLFSRLDVAASGSGPPEDDGRLEVHEILELHVNSPLLYLSGCETGLGPATATRFDRGEDYATLAQSFLYAGAQNVLATLWRVEDRSAAVLAGYFYAELREADPSQALASAQLKMLSHPEFSDPYYWAGYRLNGGGH